MVSIQSWEPWDQNEIGYWQDELYVKVVSSKKPVLNYSVADMALPEAEKMYWLGLLVRIAVLLGTEVCYAWGYWKPCSSQELALHYSVADVVLPGVEKAYSLEPIAIPLAGIPANLEVGLY